MITVATWALAYIVLNLCLAQYSVRRIAPERLARFRPVTVIITATFFEIPVWIMAFGAATLKRR